MEIDNNNLFVKIIIESWLVITAVLMIYVKNIIPLIIIFILATLMIYCFHSELYKFISYAIGIQKNVPDGHIFTLYEFLFMLFLTSITVVIGVRGILTKIIIFIDLTVGAIASIVFIEDNVYYLNSMSLHSISTYFALICILPMLLITSNELGKYIIDTNRAKWWTINNTNRSNAPDWDAILYMLFNKECDPLKFDRPPRGINIDFCKLSLILLITISLGSLYGFAFYYISSEQLPSFLMIKNQEKPGELNDNLPAFLALIASAIGVIFTYQQLRAKVRADSRQAWNDKVAELLANVLSTIGLLIGHTKSQDAEEKLHDELTRSRTHLELLLNPSEKDHRLIMFLIRIMAIPKDKLDHDMVTQKDITNAINNKNIAIGKGRNNFEIFEKIVRDTPYKNLSKKENGLIISLIFKLGAAIRKREWERIRHTR